MDSPQPSKQLGQVAIPGPLIVQAIAAFNQIAAECLASRPVNIKHLQFLAANEMGLRTLDSFYTAHRMSGPVTSLINIHQLLLQPQSNMTSRLAVVSNCVEAVSALCLIQVHWAKAAQEALDMNATLQERVASDISSAIEQARRGTEPPAPPAAPPGS